MATLNESIRPLSTPNNGIAYFNANNEVELKGFDGKSIIENGKFASKYNSLKDRNIQVYFDELKSLILKDQDQAKINELSSKIIDRLEMNKVAKEVYTNKTTQIRAIPNKSKKFTYVFLAACVLALLAGSIASGSLLHLIVPSLGIANVPILADIGMIGFSGSIGLTYLSAKIYASRNKDSKVAKHVKDLDFLIRKRYLFSNLNDSTGSVVYLLGAIVILAHLLPTTGIGMWLNFASTCMAYPTGILFIGSGLQQLYESSIDLKNAIKQGNAINAGRSLFNFVRAISVIAMGFVFLGGMQTGSIGKEINFILNALPFIVIALTTMGVSKQLYKILQVSRKGAKDKQLFLENTLTLNENELAKLKEEILNWEAKRLLKYAKSKSSSSINKNEDDGIWKKIVDDFESKDNTLSEERLKEIKEIAIKEEIKARTIKKLEYFAGKLSLETLQEVIALVKPNERVEEQSELDDKVQKVFKKVVKESVQKLIVEWMKMGINVAFLGVASVSNVVAYSLSQVILNTMNISINLTPRYRNVGVAFSELSFSVHKKKSKKDDNKKASGSSEADLFQNNQILRDSLAFQRQNDTGTDRKNELFRETFA